MKSFWQRSSRRSQGSRMRDEDIAKLSAPQLIDLIRRLTDELEMRFMEMTEE